MGGGIRLRETQRLFHAAASKLCEWSADIATCEQVRQKVSYALILQQAAMHT